MVNLAEITTYEQLLDLFEQNKSWDNQYRLIIKLGKTLSSLDEPLKVEENLVKGCESLAWLVVKQAHGKFYFEMDSDTRVVKGLMKILQILVNGKTALELQQQDYQLLLTELGLLNHLSPSRANGLLALIERINEIAIAKDE